MKARGSRNDQNVFKGYLVSHFNQTIRNEHGQYVCTKMELYNIIESLVPTNIILYWNYRCMMSIGMTNCHRINSLVARDNNCILIVKLRLRKILGWYFLLCFSIAPQKPTHSCRCSCEIRNKKVFLWNYY